jgi:hypothetical protein
MDPALILDTLSPEDMEIWHNYNFFSDDVNSNLKDSIKEENIGKHIFVDLFRLGLKKSKIHDEI